MAYIVMVYIAMAYKLWHSDNSTRIADICGGEDYTPDGTERLLHARCIDMRIDVCVDMC